jgi:hypothetical protein
MIRVAAPLGLNSAITSVLVALVVFTPNLCAMPADIADGPSLMQKVRDDIAWVGKLKSFHLLARVEERRTPEGIEQLFRKLKRQFPELDKPDPLKFTELLPNINVRLELDFDERRLCHCWLSRDDTNRELSRDLRMWDGRREVYRDQNFPEKRDRVQFRSERKLSPQGCWGWFSYLNHQPLVCWWNDTAEQREQLRSDYGDASDFVLVDRADYHGVDCHVLLDARHGFRDRYYVGVQDGRWYGVKIGVASFVDVPNFRETNRRLLEETLGRSLGANPSNEVWKEIASLPAERRIELGKRYFAAITKQVTPVWEIWYSDFRDLGEGRFLPFRENLLDHTIDEGNKKPIVSNQRTIFVRQVMLNQPLEDSLFEEAIADGAEIVDETTKQK